MLVPTPTAETPACSAWRFFLTDHEVAASAF